MSEDGQVGAEAADHSKAAGAGAAKKAAAASKTLENDLQAVYSHSHKAGKKGTGAGVLKSIMGIFSLDLSKPITLNIHAEKNIDEVMTAIKPFIVE